MKAYSVEGQHPVQKDRAGPWSASQGTAAEATASGGHVAIPMVFVS